MNEEVPPFVKIRLQDSLEEARRDLEEPSVLGVGDGHVVDCSNVLRLTQPLHAGYEAFRARVEDMLPQTLVIRTTPCLSLDAFFRCEARGFTVRYEPCTMV
jgi:hypothetical protein